MNLQQFLLTKLAEESSEIAQIALKTQQFGVDEARPGQPLTNAERVYCELDDLLAIVEMLNEDGLGYLPNRERIEAKKDKVRRFLQYSVDLGMVDQSAVFTRENPPAPCSETRKPTVAASEKCVGRVV